MADGPANTEGVNPIQGKSEGRLSKILHAFKQKLSQSKIEVKSTPPLPHEVLTIRQLKENSQIPAGSGYATIIDELQRNKLENLPDVMANEMARLYDDMKDVTRSLAEEDIENVIKELDDGNLERIAQLAELVKIKYLKGKDFINFRALAIKQHPMSSEDLKVILADQLISHIKNNYLQTTLAKRIAKERQGIIEQITPPLPQR